MPRCFYRSVESRFQADRISSRPGVRIHTETDADPDSPEITGWAGAECTGPIKASALFRLHQDGVPVSEGAVIAMTAPATKFVTFADQSTGVAYANPSPDPATITFTAKNTGGATLASETIGLLGRGHDAANLGLLLGLESFLGSITITSSVSILSLSLNAEAFPIFSALPPGEVDGSPATGPVQYFFPHIASGGVYAPERN